MQARWIKLKEATKYAAICKSKLKELAASGVIRGAKDPDSERGDWIFDRQSLDAYREAQMSPMTAREKALEIMRR
jgi:hypothetical protein